MVLLIWYLLVAHAVLGGWITANLIYDYYKKRKQ